MPMLQWDWRVLHCYSDLSFFRCRKLRQERCKAQNVSVSCFCSYFVDDCKKYTGYEDKMTQKNHYRQILSIILSRSIRVTCKRTKVISIPIDESIVIDYHRQSITIQLTKLFLRRFSSIAFGNRYQWNCYRLISIIALSIEFAWIN